MLSKYLFIALALVFSGTSLADSISTSGERIIENPVSGGSTKLRVNNGGTKVDGLTVSSTGAVAIKGTTTNDSACPGCVGEYVIGSLTFASRVGASFTAGNFGDVTSITLTTGDWDLAALVRGNTVTGQTSNSIAISTNSGNTVTDHSDGFNEVSAIVASGGFTQVIPAYRVSVASQTTYYLKSKANSGSTMANYVWGNLRARRVR